MQLGIEVPLWGGFTGGGKFTLRLWTERPKMKKEEWAAYAPHLKRAIDSAEARDPERSTKIAKVWHDKEKFLLQPELYKSCGMQLVRFPKRSGDLNPTAANDACTRLSPSPTNGCFLVCLALLRTLSAS